MKRAYVTLARALRRLLRALRLLPMLDRWAQHDRGALWLRSLLSIYDLHELLAYDVPWWTFRASEEVEAYLLKHPGSKAFEWGSGASTVWLARRCSAVISVEHDPEWAGTVSGLLPDNAEVRVVLPTPRTVASTVVSEKPGFEAFDFAAYVDAIDSVPGEFDLIVIDGRAREACLGKAIERLAPEGLIVFDNVDRQRYLAAIAGAGEGVSARTTRGLTPTLPYPTRTALITRAPIQ